MTQHLKTEKWVYCRLLRSKATSRDFTFQMRRFRIYASHTLSRQNVSKQGPKNSTGLKKMYQVEKAEMESIILHLAVRTAAVLMLQVALFWQVQRPELRFYYYLFIIDSTHCCSFDVISCLARTSSKARIKTQNAEHGNLNLAQSTINSSYILAMLWICLKVFSNMNSLHTSWSPP